MIPVLAIFYTYILAVQSLEEIEVAHYNIGWEMTANKHPTHHKIKDNPAFVSCQTERVKHGHNQCEARSINRIKKWMNSDVDFITTVENETLVIPRMLRQEIDTKVPLK